MKLTYYLPIHTTKEQMTDEIITGERIQYIAQVYIGTKTLFERKHNINKNLCLDIYDIREPFLNPSIVFLYPDVLSEFANKIHYFKYPFVLITHNSDIGIIQSPLIEYIIQHRVILRWYAINVSYSHPKIYPLPSGIANQQWEHGNLSNFNPIFSSLPFLKKEGIYMNFTIHTAPLQREKCKTICESKGVFFQGNGGKLTPLENLVSLSQHKYCICPEGNGCDTHRLWECLYVKTVPILLNTPFSKILYEKFNFPVILLDSWECLEIDNLPDYSSFQFEVDCLRMSWIKEYIVGNLRFPFTVNLHLPTSSLQSLSGK